MIRGMNQGMIEKSLLVLATWALLVLMMVQIQIVSTSIQRVIPVAHAASSRTLLPKVVTVVANPAPVPVVVPKKASPARAKTASPPAPAPTDIASAATCPNQNLVAQVSSVLLCMTKYARKFHGLGTVSTNSILTSAAAAKVNDIVTCNDFSHTACGHASDYWITTKGYSGKCSAENIAEGQTTPGAVFVAWMNSAGHRANILGPSYLDLGVAESAGPSGPLWVMELGGCL